MPLSFTWRRLSFSNGVSLSQGSWTEPISAFGGAGVSFAGVYYGRYYRLGMRGGFGASSRRTCWKEFWASAMLNIGGLISMLVCWYLEADLGCCGV